MPRTTAGKLAFLACLVGMVGGALPERVASAQPSARERVLALSRKSAEEYRAGRFAEAVKLLREAYAIDPDPTLLYNLARAYEGLGDLPAALEAYRAYLAAAPPGIADRAAIETRVATLESQIRDRERLERERALERQARQRAERDAARARRARSQEARPRRAGLAPWIVAGVGVSGLGAGAVMGLLARDRHADAEDAPSQAEAAELQSDATSFARLANVFAIGGAVVTAAGVVWLVIASREDPPPTPAHARRVEARLEWRDSAATLLFEGRF